MAQTAHRYIMSGLLEGWDWFDNSLQNLVKQAGFKPLNKSQSMMMMYVSAGLHRPIEIARKMRLSRQAIRHIANQLIEMDLLVAREDPNDGRSKILDFAEGSREIRAVAQGSIQAMEKVLAARIGQADFEALQRSLRLDWGKVIAGAQELEAVGGLPKRARPQPRPAKRTSARGTKHAKV